MKSLIQQFGPVISPWQKWGRISIMLFCLGLGITTENSRFFRCAAQPKAISRWAPRAPEENELQTLARIVTEEAARFRVDRRLVWAIIQNESSFNQAAVSPKGAVGLMQLMPATARRFNVSDSFDARQNVRGGICYLAFLLDLFDNNATLAIAAYNAGEGAVIKYGRKVPPFRETEEYVRRVSETFLSLVSPAEIAFSQSVKREFQSPPGGAAKLPVTTNGSEKSKFAATGSDKQLTSSMLRFERSVSTFLF